MKVLVTGATGFVGKRVVEKLLKNGHEVRVLTRNTAKGRMTLGNQCTFFQWNDAASEIPREAMEGVEGIIHLMGEGIADKRWSEEQKKKIYDSRIQGTARLVEAIKRSSTKPAVLVSASGVGIYGNRHDEVITESSSTHDDFLARVCLDWESEAMKAQEAGVRVAVLRTGVVIGRDGGALKKMLLPFKMGAGGPIGSGKQFMSWIHLDDLAEMYLEALKNPSITGAYNATAPAPVDNKEFGKTLGRVLHRPAVMPLPGFVLKVVFGDMAAVLLEGQKVIPARFQAERFNFKYPSLEEALRASVS